MISYGSVCSGIEAATVAVHPFGWKPAWFAEIEPFPSAALAHHYPDVQNLGDMTKIAARIEAGEIEAPTVLVGGTPCQAFSVAGLRNGLSDVRGALTISFVGLADAIDTARSVRGDDECVVWWENVPGVLSSRDNAFGCFLGALAGESCELQPPGGKWKDAGCVFGPQRTVAWRVLDAQYFGLAQRRRRVFVIASARKGFDPAAVLFEFDGVRRDTAPSREAGESAAGAITRCAFSGGAGGRPEGSAAGHFQPVGIEIGPSGGRFTDINPTLDARAKDGPIRNQLAGAVITCMAHGQGGAEIADNRRPTLTCNHEAPIACITGDITHALKGEGFDGSEDGTGRGQPIVCVHGTQDPCTSEHAAFALGRNNGQENAIAIPINMQAAAKNGEKSPNMLGIGKDGDPAPTINASDQHAVAFSAKDYGADATTELSPTLRAGNHDTSHANSGNWMAVAVSLRGREGGATAELGDDVQNCLRASSGGGDKPHVLTAMQVRRLTPVECERLQGFPDNYTLLPWRKKPASECPDGPRYKALGNSMATNVMRWIGSRIDAHLRALGGAESEPTVTGGIWQG